MGKVSPHKGQDDLIKALATYRQLYDPQARLHVVGGSISEEYSVALERFVEELGLADAVELAGVVTHEELIAYYAAADVFCCLSNHEGFCVPLLESMYHRLPIVAYANTAVPETVQGAGLVLPDKEPVRVAAAIDRVIRTTSSSGRSWPRRPPSGWRRSPCPGCRTGSPRPSTPPAPSGPPARCVVPAAGHRPVGASSTDRVGHRPYADRSANRVQFAGRRADT